MVLNSFSESIGSYGYYSVFFLMMVGMIGLLPVPEESVLIFTGVLISKGNLELIWCLPLAFLGTVSGMTAAYLLGKKLGRPFIGKFGGYIGLHQERYLRLQASFPRYGRWLLAIGYFVPGLRQVTAYFAGISQHSYKGFAWSAYIGAAVWVNVFILLGFFTGNIITPYLPWLLLATVTVMCCGWAIRKWHVYSRLTKLIMVLVKRKRVTEKS